MENIYTLPTAEILRGKNARAWVSMVLYLKTIETHTHTFLPLNISAVGSVQSNFGRLSIHRVFSKYAQFMYPIQHTYCLSNDLTCICEIANVHF